MVWRAILFCFVQADPSPAVPPAATGGSSELTSHREDEKKTRVVMETVCFRSETREFTEGVRAPEFR